MKFTDLKALLPIFPQDKLAHYQWASWLAGLAALAALPIARLLLGLPLASAVLVAATASALAAIALGIAGELSDDMANEAAAAAGEPPPHSVSWGDAYASALGCLPSALPLLALYLLLTQFTI